MKAEVKAEAEAIGRALSMERKVFFLLGFTIYGEDGAGLSCRGTCLFEFSHGGGVYNLVHNR